jgi:hypothetical protein
LPFLTRAPWLVGLAVLLLHLPFVPRTLEDLDSINFALGVREFLVADHQPHPPGYPVYIAVAKLVSLVSPGEPQALGAISAVSAAAAAWAIFALAQTWLAGAGPRPAIALVTVTALMATVLAVTSPLFSITAVRPLSDMLGLAAAIAVQAAIVRAHSAGRLAVAAGAAGLALGIRSQVVWLTVPLLAAKLWQLRSADRLAWGRTAGFALIAYAAGALAWAIPLVALSGGPDEYLHALASQGGEDFAGVAMLATQPSPRLLLSALVATWIAPWGPWPLAVIVLAAASFGIARSWRMAPQLLGVVVVGFAPYAAFHLLLQETATTRYALPLVVPVAMLAAYGVSALPARAAAAVVGLVAVVATALTLPVLRAYATIPSPAFRVLADMRGADATPPPALAMHRRQTLDMRRPLQWDRGRGRPWGEQLPAPAKHEWLELVRYWNRGGRAAVDFLADPPRSDLRLIDPQARTLRGRYRWPFDASRLLGGVRPNVMDWYRIEPPGWYLGEGWALTPETAGVAREDGRSPGRAPSLDPPPRHPGSDDDRRPQAGRGRDRARRRSHRWPAGVAGGCRARLLPGVRAARFRRAGR